MEEEKILQILGITLIVFFICVGPILLIQGIVLLNSGYDLSSSYFLIVIGIIFIIAPFVIILIEWLLMVVFDVIEIPNGADLFLPLVCYIIEAIIFVIIEIIFIISIFN